MEQRLHIIALALLASCSFALAGGLALAQEPPPTPAAEPAPAADPETTGKAEKKKGSPEVSPDEESAEGNRPLPGFEKLEISGRVHAGYAMIREAPAPGSGGRSTENEFVVERARVKLRWRPDDWFLAVLQVDVAGALQVNGSILRDAYVHLSPFDQLQIRLGQFKKPFSGLALQSPAKLRTVDRGPGVEYIVEDLLYGDRDLGLQLSGRLVKSVKLDYSIGVFNGSGPNFDDADNSKDIVGRLQIRPIKQLELGVNGSIKLFSDPTLRRPGGTLAGGGDARLQIKGFRLYAEALAAPDYLHVRSIDFATDDDDVPTAFFALGIVSYRHKFDTEVRFALEPAFKVELFDADSTAARDHLFVFTPGVNAYLGKYFKVMLGGEFVRVQRDAPADFVDSEKIEVLACFDI
jgi:hypothetical protein